MRSFYIVVVVILAASPARAWGAKKKVERHCLDILTRRMEAVAGEASDPWVRESARKCLYHLDALYAMRGKMRSEDRVTLDSKAEQRVILQAMGLAAKAEARAGFWKEKWDAVTRWAWRKVKSAIWHWLPLTPVAVWLWCSRKRLKRAVFQWDSCTNKLPQETRGTFKGKDMEREHKRLKRSGA